MSEQKSNNFLWPDVSTRSAAKKAAGQGTGAAVLVAVVTAAFATYSLVQSSSVLGFVDAWAYLDAFLFAAIAFGIHKESRIAAVAGLVLFVIEKVYQVHVTGTLQGGVLAVILVVLFLSGIRGVFALHALPQEAESNDVSPA